MKQRVMHLDFNWDTSDVNILLSAKLAKPLKGTARIIVNNIHIKGDVRDKFIILFFCWLWMKVHFPAGLFVQTLSLILFFALYMQLLLVPILEGKAIVYSFVSTPDVRIGVAFGSGVSQSLPATELPGVSSWLVWLLTTVAVIFRTFYFNNYHCGNVIYNF